MEPENDLRGANLAINFMLGGGGGGGAKIEQNVCVV